MKRAAADMPEEKQIQLNTFPVLPGDEVWITYKRKRRPAQVVEVGLANPEDTLGPNAEGARAERWDKGRRADCERFLQEHGTAPIKQKKDVWAVVEFSYRRKKKRKTLYAYCLDLRIWRLIKQLEILRARKEPLRGPLFFPPDFFQRLFNPFVRAHNIFWNGRQCVARLALRITERHQRFQRICLLL